MAQLVLLVGEVAPAVFMVVAEDAPARLEGVQAALRDRGVDAYIVPHSDRHCSEYLAERDELLAAVARAEWHRRAHNWNASRARRPRVASRSLAGLPTIRRIAWAFIVVRRFSFLLSVWTCGGDVQRPDSRAGLRLHGERRHRRGLVRGGASVDGRSVPPLPITRQKTKHESHN